MSWFIVAYQLPLASASGKNAFLKDGLYQLPLASASGKNAFLKNSALAELLG